MNNTTSIAPSNSTWLNENGIQHVKAKLAFGPAWVYIGAIAAIMFVMVCLMWVISRQINNRSKNKIINYHQLGMPTVAANFPGPLINDKAPGLSAVIYKY